MKNIIAGILLLGLIGCEGIKTITLNVPDVNTVRVNSTDYFKYSGNRIDIFVQKQIKGADQYIGFLLKSNDKKTYKLNKDKSAIIIRDVRYRVITEGTKISERYKTSDIITYIDDVLFSESFFLTTDAADSYSLFGQVVSADNGMSVKKVGRLLPGDWFSVRLVYSDNESEYSEVIKIKYESLDYVKSAN